MKPKLKFKIDYKKDIEALFSFIRDSKYDNGRSLEWAVLNQYPFLKKYQIGSIFKISKLEVEKFIKNFYQRNNDTIRKNMLLYQQNWQKKEEDFYLLVEKLFKLKYWPQGKYIAYPTIWGMFPRFLEDKTFQLPYKYKNKRYINVIIAHEMLHFIFYEYFLKKYPKYKNDKYNFFIWHISEIFNTLIQNSPEWLKVFKVKTIGYPEHKSITKILERKYYKKDDWQVDNLIKDIIIIIRKMEIT